MATFIPRPREISRQQKELTALPQTRHALPTRSNAAQVSRSDHAVRYGIAPTQASRSVGRSIDPSFRTRKHDAPADADSKVPIPATSQLISSEGAVSQNKSLTTANVLRRKRSLIGDHVRKDRENPTRGGPGNLSIRIPQQNSEVKSTSTQRQNRPSSQRLPASAVSLAQDSRPRNIQEEPRSVYHAPTPLSELSATSSLRDDSPSIFSQVSPASTNTPTTSVTGCSPQAVQSPHFGPGYSTLSPIAKSQPTRHHQSSQKGPQPLTSTSLSETRNQQVPSLAKTRTVTAGTAVLARETLAKANTLRQPNRALAQVRPTATIHREEGAIIVRPPELAHLETANTAAIASRPPERPSRDGVEDLTALPAYLSPREGLSQIKTNFSRARAFDTDDLRQMPRSQPTRSVARMRLSIKPPERPKLIDTTVSPASASLRSRSTTSGKSSSRFGFFHRKDKTLVATSEAEDSTQVKKGPTAGTGHEGYGRYTSKRRSSGGTSSKRGSSGSASSHGGDDFLTRKAAPVYLRKDPAGQLVQSDRTSNGCEGSRTSQMSSGWSYDTLQSSMQQANVAPRTRSPPTPEEAPSVSRDIASRGSSSRGRGGTLSGITTRSRNVSKDAKRGPTPENDIQTPPVSRQPTPFAESLTGLGSSLAIAGKAKTSTLRSFFGLGNSKTKPSSKSSKLPAPIPLTTTGATMDASPIFPTSIQPGKTLAHYEMMGSSDDISQPHNHVEMEEIGEILDEAVLTDAETQSEAEEVIRYASSVVAPVNTTVIMPVESAEVGLTLAPELQQQHSNRSHHKVALPVPPRLRSGLAGSQKNNDERQSRLPQVANHIRNTPNEKSFSRPFDGSRSQPGGAPPESQLPSSTGHFESQMHRRRPSSSSNSFFAHDLPQAHSDHPIRDVHTRSPDDAASPLPSFFAIPARKNSDFSVSSSSGSIWFPIHAETAVPPRPGAHVSPDEVWQEYDDLIEKVLTPSESQPSSNEMKTTKEPDYFSEKPHYGEKKIDGLKSKTSTPFPQLSEMAASNGTKLSPFTGIEKRLPDFRGLQHPALPTLQPPVRPLPETPGSVLHISSASQLIRRSSMKTKKQTGDKSIDNPNKVDLRKAALDVSKWMSFDQVLVSPAHDELQIARDEKVLVVDGLGKEWSLFCAKNYPNTQVFGLSPAPYEPGPNQSTSPLPNYRHMRSSNLAVSFPFPQNTFHTVVFRFPAATSEFSLGRAISECKRVLRPGGFLEICVMDLDLDIMGPKTRRAVKGLKEKLQQGYPDVSLKPTSDYVQYLLGRYGLENLNRVMIGVPVAGVISSSPDRSKDEGAVMKPAQLPKSSHARRNEIFRTLAPKVARWWYTQTYEQKILATSKGSKSIWDDQGLLKECKDKQAAFRLLICHAQKPVLNKRKTQSL